MVLEQENLLEGRRKGGLGRMHGAAVERGHVRARALDQEPLELLFSLGDDELGRLRLEALLGELADACDLHSKFRSRPGGAVGRQGDELRGLIH